LADLLVHFRDVHIVFNLFSYLTFRSAVAFVLAFLLSYLLLGWYIRKFGNSLYERISEDVPERHRKKEGTPSSGGLVFMPVALMVTLLLASPVPEVLTAVFATSVMGALPRNFSS